MVENVENLVLEHLKRVANLEGSVASIIQHLGHLAAADAAQQISIDKINSRLDRIERRLVLAS
jgi:uncharacterized coiled-coil protein SlyX